VAVTNKDSNIDLEGGLGRPSSIFCTEILQSLADNLLFIKSKKQFVS